MEQYLTLFRPDVSNECRGDSTGLDASIRTTPARAQVFEQKTERKLEVHITIFSTLCIQKGRSDAWRSLDIVSGLPNVSQADGRVEAVEEHQRHCCVFHDDPGLKSVVTMPHEELAGRLGLEGVHDPHGDVDDHQKGHGFSARLFVAQRGAVAAPSKTVDDERSLGDNLRHGGDLQNRVMQT